MIDLIKKILGNKNTDKALNTETGDINLATCAILIEMANADGKFSSQEKDRIINIFKSSTIYQSLRYPV